MTGSIERLGREPVPHAEAVRAHRDWWDAQAAAYQAEHGDFLGAARFVWGPEGLDEDEAQLLGPVAALRGRPVLEVGAGAGQCARWLRERDVLAVGLDVSEAQLQEGRRLEQGRGGRVPAVVADACALPFRTHVFDAAFAAYGAVPFVPAIDLLLAEVARVLRPGSPWVFSVTHPVRWAFPDDPGPAGLTATASYFDRRPYVERDEDGRVAYTEHHRTLGDLVRAVVAAGFVLEDLVEPEWPTGNEQVWGGWSPLRGRMLPGTAVLRCRLPA